MNLPPEAELSERTDVLDGSARIYRTLGDLQKTITMAQIAKTAAVSQGAISSLLNDRDYGIRVSEKTRERVFKVCREMGYIPNDLRAVVRMYPEFGDSCLLLSTEFAGGLTHPFVSRIAAAAMSAIDEPSNPLTIACYDAAHDYSSAPDSLPHPVRFGVSSKFLFLGTPNGSLLDALHRRGLPVVSLGDHAPLPGVLSLVPDYAQASRLALEHLLKLGHQRLAIVSGPFGDTSPRQLALNHGVRLACDEFGLSIEAQNIIYGDLSGAAGSAAVERLFDRTPQPTAIFCQSDAAAGGALATAQARGVKVPAQLSIVGCSDDPGAQFTAPKLTTVHIPAEQMGALGIKQIDRLVREPLGQEPRQLVLPVRLVPRDSSGPPEKS